SAPARLKLISSLLRAELEARDSATSSDRERALSRASSAASDYLQAAAALGFGSSPVRDELVEDAFAREAALAAELAPFEPTDKLLERPLGDAPSHAIRL